MSTGYRKPRTVTSKYDDALNWLEDYALYHADLFNARLYERTFLTNKMYRNFYATHDANHYFCGITNISYYRNLYASTRFIRLLFYQWRSYFYYIFVSFYCQVSIEISIPVSTMKYTIVSTECKWHCHHTIFIIIKWKKHLELI